MLDRKIFDRDLALRAESSGAELKVDTQAVGLINNGKGEVCGIRVKENGRESECQTRLVIAADGIEFHFGTKLAPGGYAWVFPKGKGLANVGLAITPTFGNGIKAKELLDFFVMKRFKSFSVVEWMTGGVPAFSRKSRLVKDNILLAGDAARLVDSLSGAGIANALLSGKIAGQVASEYLANRGNSPDFLKKYEEEFLKIKGRELRFYSYCRKIYLKMKDEDFEEIILFLREYLKDKDATRLTPIQNLKAILRSNPKLLLLLRHLV